MITKEELETLIKGLNVPYNDSISSEENKNQFPRIVYWDFLWDPISASNEEYNTVVTYQISVYTRKPRDPALIALKHALASEGIKPRIQHEFIDDGRYFHAYMAIDVVEDI